MRQRRDRLDQLLAVVQYQQDVVRRQPAGQDRKEGLRLPRRLLLAQSQCSGQKGGQQRGVREGGQLHKGRAVDEVVRSRMGDLDRQACLADAAGAHQGDEPRRRDPLAHLAHLLLAPDEARERMGRAANRR